MQFKKLQAVSVLLFCLSFYSCGTTPSQENITKPADMLVENQPVILPAKDTIYSKENDSTILLKNKEAFVKGHITANKHQPVFTIEAAKGDTIIATIRPLEKSGNVRINQIQKSNGSFDGPFGDSLQYIMRSTGKLSFIIGENMMAGDPWTGYFILHLKVK